MNRKLIFFDIDGTLITEGPDHYVPDSTTKALDMLRRCGHICLINTGRVYAALDQLIRSIHVDGYVCGCGTNIRLGDQVLLSHRLAPETSMQVIRALDATGMEWMLEGEHQLYFSQRPYTTHIGDIINRKAKLPDCIHSISPNEYDQAVFSKFIMVVPNGKDPEGFMHAFGDEMTFIDRGKHMYEVVPKAFSKATGMRFVEEYFGISHEDTIAVGDIHKLKRVTKEAARRFPKDAASPVASSAKQKGGSVAS